MRDLTKGSIIKMMLLFSIPILLGNIFQQAYNLTDIIIVGKKLGTESYSAVGATSSVVSLMINIINGIVTGCAIPVSKYYGMGNQDKMRRYIAGMASISFVSAAVITILCLMFMRPLLIIINTPEDIIDQAQSYLTIVVAGLIVTMFYNLEAAILRAVGNTFVPLLILITSTVLNIGMDLLLLFVLETGVWGAAAATVTAQLISAAVCFIYLIKKCPYLRLKISDFKIDRSAFTELLGAGFGMALMYSIVDLGSVILQNGINGFGSEIISAHTAARKFFSLTIMPFSAISATLVTFVSQNLGAKKFDRIKNGIKYGIMIEYIWTITVILLVYLFGRLLLTVIAPENNGEIIDTALGYMKINVPFYFALSILLSLRSSLQGLGRSGFPIIASIIELSWKFITVIAVIPACGYFGVCISEPIIWTLSGILVLIIMLKTMKNYSFDT